MNKRQTITRNKWSEEEKEILMNLYTEYGDQCWKTIPKLIPGRREKDARQIWRYHLRPETNKTPFTVEEQKKIRTLREQKQMGWSEMEKHFPGRDQIRLKNEYKKIKRHEKKRCLLPVQEKLHLIDEVYELKNIDRINLAHSVELIHDALPIFQFESFGEHWNDHPWIHPN